MRDNNNVTRLKDRVKIMYIGRKGNFSHFYITKPRQVLVLWSSHLDIRVRIIPPVNVDYQMCEIVPSLSISPTSSPP